MRDWGGEPLLTEVRGLFCGLAAVICLASTGAAEGLIVDDIVNSKALEDNFIGDSPRRDLRVYLPPRYDNNPDREYSVVYLLHGYPGEKGGRWEFVRKIADTLIESGVIKPMILVAPHSRAGCFYVNSSAVGDWEDFIVYDVVEYIDQNYRTVPEANSRGIAGHSMGGSGAISLAMKHPDVFTAAYGMSGGLGPIDREWLTEDDIWWSVAVMNRFPSPETFADNFGFALSAVWSPNPDRKPLQIDLPVEIVDGQVQVIDSVLDRWDAQTPVKMVASHTSQLRSLSAIAFDVGISDWVGTVTGNREFSAALTEAGIAHIYEEYDGDHGNKVVGRTRTHLLPFFSEVLGHD
ncbi:MAG: alpha/beta hydrolase-fold protein [Candidatus Latescibacteria bacterium]|nr:alpha/beta hydrolase-fold protein [Candidatus Latescibacterota bacterium]